MKTVSDPLVVVVVGSGRLREWLSPYPTKDVLDGFFLAQSTFDLTPGLPAYSIV